MFVVEVLVETQHSVLTVINGCTVSVYYTDVVCVISMLHGSETWPVKKENVLTLLWTDVRMISWMCGVKVTDRFTCSELR